MKCLVCLFACGLGACADNNTASPSLGLSEVSVLVPLPTTTAERDVMLKPSDAGAKGTLVPDWALPNPALLQSEDRAVTVGKLRLVATRLDPCWPDIGVADLSKCQRVLHLVWQPIVPAWESGATTLAAADAAVHTFYRLTDTEFAELVDGLARLDGADALDRTAPLDVNAAIAAQGIDGTYFAGFRDLVLAHAGADNVFEMTFLALRASLMNPYLGQGWLLSGATTLDGQVFRVTVATTSDDEQHFGNNVATGQIEDQASFLGDFTPQAANTDVLLDIVGDSAAAETADLAKIQAAVDLSLVVENPLRTTLESADCMSCHISTTARRWAEQHRGIDVTNNPNRYTNPDFDLTLTSQSIDRTNAIHGLGWYGIHTAISQRTVNDTAAAASFIHTHLGN